MDQRLNIKPKTIKHLGENTGKKTKTNIENLCELGLGRDFLDRIPKVQSIKEKIDKLDFIKIKNFCSLKNTVNRMKRQVTNCEKIFVIHVSDERNVPRIHKDLSKLK